MSRTIPDYDFKLKDVSLKSLNIFKKITIDLPITTQASSFSADVFNESADYNNYFDYHDDVKIYFGYESDGVVGLFHGRVEKLKKSWKPSGSVITVSGRGTWTLMLEKMEVKSFLSTELGDIIKDLISSNVTGLTTVNVGNSGITPDTEVVDHAFIQEKVKEYCTKAGFDAWVDFDDDLHFTGTPGANTVSLVAGENIKEIELSIDWKKIRNYIRGYGKKVEGVQLIKTEEDAASQAKYGVVMKIIKDSSLDETSLIQSIMDAALLEDKEAEWGGVAVIPGDERIVPAKSITVTVPALDVDESFKVQHVQHVFEPSGGFTTNVMLVEEEVNTSKFYKDLYEKTGNIVDYANSGNYEESYVYKFTADQDSLWTFNNCYTTNSTLKITDSSSASSATLTSAIVGDKNYSSCLPFVSQEYEGANKFFVSNDSGSSWEQVYADEAHDFISNSGDKNDFKCKIELSARPALEVSCVATDLIYGIDTDTSTLWSFEVPDTGEEIWGLAYGEAKLWQCENSTGKIYETNPEDGSSESTLVDKAYTLGGCTYHDSTSRLFVVNRTDDEISEVNTSTGLDSYTHALPAAIDDPTGLTFDGSDFWMGDKTDDLIYKITTASTGDNVAWVSTDGMPVSGVTDPYDLTWDGANLRVVSGGDGKVYRIGYGTYLNQSQTTNSSNTYFGNHILVAQSFQIDMSKDCSSVEVYMKRNATASDVTCIIASDDTGKPGSTLKSKTNSGVSTSGHWEKFTWASAQALTASTTYWIIVKSESSDYNDYQVYYNSAGGYSSGQAAVDLSDQFTEAFTGTTYKDAVNTTLEWDTAEGKAKVWYIQTNEEELSVASGHAAAFWNSGTENDIIGFCIHGGTMWFGMRKDSDETTLFTNFSITAGSYGDHVGDYFWYDEREDAEKVGGVCSDGTNLFILNAWNDLVSKRNASNPATEDTTYNISSTISGNGDGITWDGTYFWIGDGANIYKFSSNFTYQSSYITQDYWGDFGSDGVYLVGADSVNRRDIERWSSGGYKDTLPFKTKPNQFGGPSEYERGGKRYFDIDSLAYGIPIYFTEYSVADQEVYSTTLTRGNALQNITKATLTATASIPSGTSATYYMSANGGSNWETVSSGVEKTFTYPGTEIKWKAVLDQPGGSAGFAEISNIQIDVMGGATADWQTQTDDLAFKVNLDDILYPIDSFTPPGGTPRGLTYKTEQGASDVYTFGAYLK